MTNFKKLCAFTLAEALITLGVVGVLSALTIPTLVKNHQKKVTVEKLKSEYAKLQEAIHLSSTENLEFKYWDFNQPSNVLFEQYLAKYLKIVDKQTMSKNGALGITYRQLSGKPENALYLMCNKDTIYTTVSGAQYIVSQNRYLTKNGFGFHLILDINGVKGPNQFGKDVFYLDYDKSHPDDLYFMGKYSDSEFKFEKEPNGDRQVLLGKKNPKKGGYYNYQCNKSKRGLWCGHLIQLDGWKIKNDYPW